MDIIELPVSIGEAIDKLTILDIKCEKITDNRKLEVQKEYDILYSKLQPFISSYNKLYLSMKKINSIIWDQMDVLRDGEISDDEYSKLCRKCIETNDVRFRIKNKINLISKSKLKEQKSYNETCIFIKLNCNKNTFALLEKPIECLSYMYDKIIITTNRQTDSFDELSNLFYYDNTIEFNIVCIGSPPQIVSTKNIINTKSKSKTIILDEQDYDKNIINQIFEIDEMFNV
jgi:hypothetical protein